MCTLSYLISISHSIDLCPSPVKGKPRTWRKKSSVDSHNPPNSKMNPYTDTIISPLTPRTQPSTTIRPSFFIKSLSILTSSYMPALEPVVFGTDQFKAKEKEIVASTTTNHPWPFTSQAVSVSKCFLFLALSRTNANVIVGFCLCSHLNSYSTLHQKVFSYTDTETFKFSLIWSHVVQELTPKRLAIRPDSHLFALNEMTCGRKKI